METKNTRKGLGLHTRRIIAYVVLVIITFFCLFWFYLLFVNATRSNGQMQAGIYTCAEHIPSDELEKSSGRNASGMERYDKQYYRSQPKCSVIGIFFNHDSLCDPRL